MEGKIPIDQIRLVRHLTRHERRQVRVFSFGVDIFHKEYFGSIVGQVPRNGAQHLDTEQSRFFDWVLLRKYVLVSFVAHCLEDKYDP